MPSSNCPSRTCVLLVFLPSGTPLKEPITSSGIAATNNNHKPAWFSDGWLFTAEAAEREWWQIHCRPDCHNAGQQRTGLPLPMTSSEMTASVAVGRELMAKTDV